MSGVNQLAERREVRWAVVGRHGLYVGQWLTRGAAIAQHVFDTVGTPSPFFFRTLTPEQKVAWQACRRRGDRVVRVVITWWETAQ